jgi:hypothetical protein
MGPYLRIELAPLARVLAVDEPVAVAARRATLFLRCRRVGKNFVKVGFNLCRTSLNRLVAFAIRSRRQDAFARPERSFPGVNIHRRKVVHAYHCTHVV